MFFSTKGGALTGFLLLCCSGASLVAAAGERWVDIWGSMPQLVEPANLPSPPWNGSSSLFKNATLRQTVYITQDASTIRVQFSNAFGGSELPITAATVALPVSNTNSSGAGTGAIKPETLRSLTFSGSSSFVVPNGALFVSDPISINVKAQSVLTVTVYLATGQSGFAITGHPGSRTTSFIAPGNLVSAPDLSTASGVGKTDHWYFLSTIQGNVPSSSGALAIIGDSITDGRGSTTNANNRWPDQLLARLQSSRSTKGISVINQAAGGNRILADGLGPNALGRIERDVLAHHSTKYVIVFIGVNDLGTAPLTEASLTATADRLIAAYDQMITRLHDAGIAVFGATITPMSGPGQVYGDPVRENARQRVNQWIRTGTTGGGVGSKKGGGGKPGHGNNSGSKFDGVIDFDTAVRDKTNGTQLDASYDSGDFLHLNPTGYKTMAAVVDLGLFERFR
ncbi:SGNH hydrolase-type esterase domain-containing protein [Apodospora peruviana]|uniref:SGNH hydrolase-type esterase domain-containing protein n=1 Tax=Apodospora peruviana TaxID=516989 RepID=A0AAE0IPQ5_9PEZI|nr:SGNH hydrolase-type esterase domain-containing protein [Apodospora peruviana]